MCVGVKLYMKWKYMEGETTVNFSWVQRWGPSDCGVYAECVQARLGLPGPSRSVYVRELYERSARYHWVQIPRPYFTAQPPPASPSVKT